MSSWRGGEFDAIVISTLPAGVSRRIGMDVVSRLRRRQPSVRLIHVVANEVPTHAPPSTEAP